MSLRIPDAYDCAALALLLACGCSRPKGAPANLLIITIDTERRDHLDLYGYGRETAPRLKRLATEGVTFADAITPIPKTAPALATLFTGLNPSRHGVRHNLSETLSPDARTLAEILKDRGYRTAAFVSNQVLSRSVDIPARLDRGFDSYEDRLTRAEAKREKIHEQPAEPLTDAAIRWIESRPPEPFFLWVHYIDPHGPYDPPEPFRSRFASAQPFWVQDDEAARSTTGLPAFFSEQNLLDGPDRHDLNLHVDRYDGEIAYADSQVGRLLDAFDRTGFGARTLAIYAADHGESFGEHGVYFEHGLDLYQENLRIPLVMRFPHRIRPRATVGERVQLADLFATCLDWLDVPLPAGIDGRSLRAAAEGGVALQPAPIYLETNEATGLTQRWPRGLVEGDWKCVLGCRPVPGTQPQQSEVSREELYNLREDPGEKRNRYASEPERAARMRQRILEHVAPTTLDPRAARLEAIAYFGARGPSDPFLVYESWKAAGGVEGVAPLVGAGSAVVPILARAMASDPEPLLSLESEAIRRIGWSPSVPALREALVAAARDARAENVARIRETLSAFVAESVASEMAKALRGEKEPLARRTAALALASGRYHAAAPALLESLADPDRDVRLAAVTALRAFAPGSERDDGIPAVLERLRAENETSPRDGAMVLALSDLLFEQCGRRRDLFGDAAPPDKGGVASAPDSQKVREALARAEAFWASRKAQPGR